MTNTLAAVFLLGFAVQRLLEIGDPLVQALADKWFPGKPKGKEWTAGLVSLVLGLLLAALGGVRLLCLSWSTVNWALDVLVTGVVLSAGTDAVNTVMKYLGYLKREAKQRAAAGA